VVIISERGYNIVLWCSIKVGEVCILVSNIRIRESSRMRNMEFGFHHHVSRRKIM
jgi:hypothetical protein